ncbi:MAG: DNA modification methylase [Deltaproteobacteria bacterium]
MNLSDLKPAPHNPRKISEKQLARLKKSLAEFGDLSGVIFNRRTGNIIGGHQRVKVMPPDALISKIDLPGASTAGTVAEGRITVDGESYTYREVDWPIEREKMANIAANKHTGEWDDEKLEELLVRAFQTAYGGSGGRIFNDNLSDDDCIKLYSDVLKNLYEHTTDDASIYWWFAMENHSLNAEAFKKTKWHISQIIIWLKNSMVISHGQDYHRQYEPCIFGWKKGKNHYRNKNITDLKDIFNLDFDDFIGMLDVWYEKRDNTATYIHPTQKPVRLAERGLKKNSEPGDIVVDLFGGSGSTLMACDQMVRRARLMELDPKYCDVIVKRWQAQPCAETQDGRIRYYPHPGRGETIVADTRL